MLRMAANTLTILSLLCIKLTAIEGAPTSECCQSKEVGDTTYVLVNQADTSDYNCLDSCIYEDKQVSGSRVCFQEGDLPVKCLNDQGCKCGIKKKSRIIGGEETEVNEFPWMAALADEDGMFYCGGTLVASQWVLTASHCMWNDEARTVPTPANQIRIVLGDHDKIDDYESNITKEIKVDYYKNHPNFDIEMDFDSDITMIKLAEEVDLNVYTPACLANTGEVFTGMNAWVYGWGSKVPTQPFENPNKLKKVNVTIVSDEVCQKKSSDLGWDIKFTNGMLCAGGVAGEDSCVGDSGGPLTVDVDGQHILVGDVSYGHPDACAQAGFFGIYAEVAVFREWVDAVMATDGKPKICPV